MGLDLSSLENWTHELLEEMARKRGIRSPEFRRHSELVRLLLRQQYGEHLQASRGRVARGVATAGLVRKSMGMLVGAAIEQLVPQALAALLGRGERRITAAPAAGPRGPAPASTLAPSGQRVAGAAHRLVATTRNFVEAPSRTRAMARLLASQGHRDHALAIYAELVERAAEAGPALRAEMEAIRRGDPVETRLRRAGAGWSRPGAALPPAADRLTCDVDPDSSLRLQWSITDAGLRRARAVLAEEGEIALRVLSIERDPDAVVRSAITEHGPVGASGTWNSGPLPHLGRSFVAVGLRAGERFVAIVHTKPRPGLLPPPERALHSA